MGTVPTSLASALSRIYYASGAGFADSVFDAFAFRPPQWAGAQAGLLGAAPAAVGSLSTVAGAIVGNALAPLEILLHGKAPLSLIARDPNTGNQVAYVFDGIIRAEHSQQAVATLNPVQTGAAITDHVYVVPARLIVEIAMSDAMQSFTLGQWADGPSKSISAYQKLIALQAQRLPVQVATKLRQYDKMFITDIVADEEAATKYGLRAHVTFTQLITTSVQMSSLSNVGATTLPQTVGQTLVGQSQALLVPAAVQTQNFTSQVSSVPGAGSWSSVNIGN